MANPNTQKRAVKSASKEPTKTSNAKPVQVFTRISQEAGDHIEHVAAQEFRKFNAQAAKILEDWHRDNPEPVRKSN